MFHNSHLNKKSLKKNILLKGKREMAYILKKKYKTHVYFCYFYLKTDDFSQIQGSFHKLYFYLLVKNVSRSIFIKLFLEISNE